MAKDLGKNKIWGKTEAKSNLGKNKLGRYTSKQKQGGSVRVVTGQRRSRRQTKARWSHEIQWPLARDEAAVKLDDSHYFFSFRAPKGSDYDEENEDRRELNGSDSDLLSYGLTIASKGQEGLLKELDAILEKCSSFSVQKVSEKGKKKGEVLDGSVATVDGLWWCEGSEKGRRKEIRKGRRKEHFREERRIIYSMLASLLAATSSKDNSVNP